MQLGSQIIRSEVRQVFFGFYNDDDRVEQLSSSQVTQPVTLDSNGTQIKNGLYDPRMGPLEQTTTCLTCLENYMHCPGHCGHIALDVPVYNPVLFPSMFQLLRSKCCYCHRFRLASKQVNQYLVQLKLLEMNDLAAFLKLEDMDESTAASSSSEDKIDGKSIDKEKLLQHYEKKYEKHSQSSLLSSRSINDAHIQSLQKNKLQEFYDAVKKAKRCANCGGHSPVFRKDGYAKIFQKPLAEKNRQLMTAKKLKLTSGLEALRKQSEDPHPSTATEDDTGIADMSGLIDNATDEEDNEQDDDDDDDEDVDGLIQKASQTYRVRPTTTTQQKSKASKSTESDLYLVPLEVEAQLQLLWQREASILDFIWKKAINCGAESFANSKSNHPITKSDTWKLFFTRNILVPPNKFRPSSVIGDSASEHPQNVHLKKILELNEKIITLHKSGTAATPATAIPTDGKVKKEETTESSKSKPRSVKFSDDLTMVSSLKTFSDSLPTPLPEPSSSSEKQLSKVVTSWIELQNSVNCFIDSSKDPNPLGSQAAPSGIRQLLERKEGLFRRHMMGKRVNYCCRSVISPDPYIGSSEIGIPKHFAMSLQYPIPVTDWNVKYLRGLVERGPHVYPGANQIEYSDGRIVKLDKLSSAERSGKAKLLLNEPGLTKVYRHLIDGDSLLVNRQPTLHKPGIMAHKARVLTHVKEQTLRMNYANCNTYNADFDGDEMNCHFVQNEIARAEATYICNTDNQYIVPTSGNPLRGLIQDHVAGAIKLTCKDTFLTRSEFQQLLYVAVSGLAGTEITTHHEELTIPPPAVWKPKRLWTGKQIISALISQLCRPPLPPLNLDGKTRTPPTALGAESSEHVVIFRQGELLCGVLDKASIGNTSLGIVHAVYELYGAELAGRLLNGFGRLFTLFLQDAGHSCGIQDLTLCSTSEKDRKKLLQVVSSDAVTGLDRYLTGQQSNPQNQMTNDETVSKGGRKESLEKMVEAFLGTDRKNSKVKLDAVMQGTINKSASDVIKACLPNGLERPFLKNHFSLMVLTGAKGSAVNQSQISCFLGQQALEGQRVPMMSSGKTLPSFRAFDSNARAGGFVRDRFLTGVRPQEYYFHCMAGREGLVDTAVKTSRSGYLQRCLVKHLEELKVAYDMTVRDSGGNVVQFLYGEDGLDPTSSALLGCKNNHMQFLCRNNQALVYKYSINANYFNQGLDMTSAQRFHRRMSACKSQRDSQLGLDALDVGHIIFARRRRSKTLDWSRGNIAKGWHLAEVVRRRSSSKPSKGGVSFDIKYLSMPTLIGKTVPSNEEGEEKKMPLMIRMDANPLTAGSTHNSMMKLPLYLMRLDIPKDTAMSSLELGRSVGAVSEKMQDSLVEYVGKNPDEVITAESTESTVAGEGLELLVWVKFMRSLACPGEAVGCVAAQSVGEPSTQMTLNTFHLAGHGGANVTLGIPRLREIIMTASKTLKTPTMTIPLKKGSEVQDAHALSRQLSRLPLDTLLHHQHRIEVEEEISRESKSSRWDRNYRLRLYFESFDNIQSAFGVSFDSVLAAVKGEFMQKVSHLILVEQRRAGENNNVRNESLLRSASKRNAKKKKKMMEDGETTGGEEEGGGGDLEGGEELDGRRSSSKGRGSGRRGGGGGNQLKDGGMESEEDEGDDEESDDDRGVNNEDLGILKKGKGDQERMGYNDDNDGDEDGEDGDERRPDERSDGIDFGSDDEVNNTEWTAEFDNAAPVPTNTNKKGLNGTVATPKNKKSVAGSSKTESSTSNPSSSSSGPTALSNTAHSGGFTINREAGWIEVKLTFPTESRRLLMMQIAEKAALATMVRFTKDILQAYPLTASDKKDQPHSVQTEGVNFEAIWEQPDALIEVNAIQCNDIWQILQTYGVEAARQSIVLEISAVFAVYGIDVNPRHLSLIADYMTRNGSYIAMNRIGMNECPSPLLQMSFETTCTFLQKAAQDGLSDNLQSPSARIVLGAPPTVGTGCFDVMIPIPNLQEAV